MSGFDYLTVAAWPEAEPGFCMLEWDVALDQRSRINFAHIAREQPGRVLVAPYLYGDGWLPAGIDENDDQADTFGFGCIYFPQLVLREALAHFRAREGRLTDQWFCDWHRDRYGTARVTWAVHPQHLHEFG